MFIFNFLCFTIISMENSIIAADISSALTNRVKEKIAAIDAIANDLPSVIIIHNLRTRSVEYMSERGLKLLNTTLQELKSLGEAYFDEYFNPEDAKNYFPKFLDMLQKNDLEEVFSYFQQVRTKEDGDWEWYLSSAKVFMFDDYGSPFLCITTANPIDELKSITYKIERLLEEKEMMRNQLTKYGLLTKREKEIVKLLVSGKKSSEIAEMLFVSVATVEQHRKNIKRKIGIKNLPEMVRFAQAFDMA